MIDDRSEPGLSRRHLPDWAVITLVVVAPLIGLILVWKSTPWRTGTKVLVTSLYVPPVAAWWIRHAGIRSGWIRLGVWLAIICWISLNVGLLIYVFQHPPAG